MQHHDMRQPASDPRRLSYHLPPAPDGGGRGAGPNAFPLLAASTYIMLNASRLQKERIIEALIGSLDVADPDADAEPDTDGEPAADAPDHTCPVFRLVLPPPCGWGAAA